jgi:transposase InsO family protein
VVGELLRGARPVGPHLNDRTLRRELLERILVVNHAHLRRVLEEYLIHYNRHRPHRTLGQRPPEHRASVAPPVEGPVRRRRILGGLVNEYHRAA